MGETKDGQMEVAAETEVEPRLSSFLRLFKIPSTVWAHLTLSEPRSTRAVVSGVSVSLYTFGLRQSPKAGETKTAPVPVSAAVPSPQFVFGEGSRVSSSSTSRPPGRSRLGSQEGAPPSSVRRKRPRSTPAAPETEGTTCGEENVAQERRSETHVVVRQWGAEVTLAVLPPLHVRQPEQQNSKPQTDTCKAETPERGPLRKPLPSPFENEIQPNGTADQSSELQKPDASLVQNGHAAAGDKRKPLTTDGSWTVVAPSSRTGAPTRLYMSSSRESIYIQLVICPRLCAQRRVVQMRLRSPRAQNMSAKWC